MDWVPVGEPTCSTHTAATVPEELGSLEYGCAVIEPEEPPEPPPPEQSSLQVDEVIVKVTGTETPVAPDALNWIAPL